MPSRRESRRFLASLLLTDIVGSTDLAARLGDREWRRLLEGHNTLVRRELRAHRGREMDTAGDGFFAVFEAPESAVRCAAAICAGVPALGLQVRAGVHTGECELINGKAGGMAVNIAARIAAIAGAGQVLVSSSTRDMTTGSGLQFTGGAERELKGVADTWRVYELVPPEVSAAPGPARAPTGQLRGGGRRRALLAAAALVVAAVAVPLALRATSAPEDAQLVANAVGVVDGDRATAIIPVGQRPTGVATDARAVWVTNSTSNTVSRIDRATKAVTPIPVGAGPLGIAVGEDAVWVANAGDSTVSRIDPARNAVTSTAVAAGPTGVATGAGSVWVTNALDASVTRIDPVSAKVLDVIPVGAGPSGIAFGLGSVWVANQGDGTVSRIDPQTRKLRGAPIRVGNGPTGIAVGKDAVWVANSIDGSLSRIDARDSSVTTARIAEGAGTYGIAVRGRAVWVSNENAGTLSRVDDARLTVTRTIKTSGAPLGLAYVGDELWFANADGGSAVHRGGTLTIAARGIDSGGQDPPVLDPFNVYEIPLYTLFALTNDGLVGFRRTAGIQGSLLVSDLATSLPVPTEGGRTYAFTLRPGLTYSTGVPVRAGDIRRGLERALRSRVGPGFLYHVIRGADRCDPSRPVCDLSQGVVTDDADGTVTFHLTQPDPVFLHKLALPAASAIPEGVPLPLPPGQFVPATGPYMITAYQPRRIGPGGRGTGKGRLELSRNPKFKQWSAAAQPNGYSDRIVFETGLSAADAVGQVTSGRADVHWQPVAPEMVAELRTRRSAEVHTPVQAVTSYFFLNTRVPPFDNRDARRAFAYALDRGELAGDTAGFGFGQVTCQMLPPDFPGYRPYCPFSLGSDATRWRAPDFRRAQTAMAASGAAGSRVVMTYGDAPGHKAVAQRALEVLTSLGFRASLKPFPDEKYFPYVSDSRNKVQMGLSGWGADYPAASNFLDTLLSCSAFKPGDPVNNVNLAGFCDKKVQKLIDAALRQQTDSPASAIAAWAAAERAIVDAAPIVPFSNPVQADLVGRRVGNYQSTVQLGMLLAQMWVQ